MVDPPSMALLSATPDVGHTEPGAFEILLLPLFGVLLAGVVAGLVAAVTVALVKPWTGAGLRPPEPGYAPWSRLGVPVGASVLGTVTVAAVGLHASWLGVDGSTTGAALLVLVVGVLMGAALHRLHFGAAAPPERRAGRYSYGVFVVVWTATTVFYYAIV
jgi:hypothetical protein